MTSPSSRFVLHRLLLRALRLSKQGFTLLELLVAIIIAAIVVSGLLFLVMELLKINNREEALTQTQRDMRRAIDYISRDAREAVFVYSTPSDVTGELTDLPSGATPILAFWRIDPIDGDRFASIPECSTTFSSDEDKERACEALKIRHSMYTLVVYLQRDNSDSDIWEGPSRIIRYELPRYKASNLTSLTETEGYQDPSLGTTFGFENWVRDPADTETNGNAEVLTDHVDNASTDPGNLPTCPAGMRRTPPADPAGYSFFACVRDPLDPNDDRINQDLLVFLRGNATDGRPGLLTTFSEEGRLPTLKSQVLIRGIEGEQ